MTKQASQKSKLSLASFRDEHESLSNRNRAAPMNAVNTKLRQKNVTIDVFDDIKINLGERNSPKPPTHPNNLAPQAENHTSIAQDRQNLGALMNRRMSKGVTTGMKME